MTKPRNPNSLITSNPVSGVPQWIEALRCAMFDAITEGDVREMMQGIVAKAKAGDVQAQKMIFNYVLGGQHITKVTNNNLIVPPADSPLPNEPTPAVPGSRAKLAAMAQRASNGESLHHPSDS